MPRRTDRVNELLKKEFSELVTRHLKDPRLGGLVTITEIDCAPDLSHARVYVSVMAAREEQARVLEGLESALGFIRHQLRTRLAIRRIPQFRLILDSSLEQGNDLLTLMDQVASESSASTKERI